MDRIHLMGFLVLILTTLMFVLQFADPRVLEYHSHNTALSQHNSTVTFDSDLDAVAVVSSTPNYTGAGGHATNYSESDPGSNSGSSTEDVTITVEFLQKEATPGDGGSSKAAAGIEEVTPIEGNADTLHEILKSHSSHMGVNDGIQGNILSSGQSPGVGHWEKTKSKYSTTRASNVLSSSPSPGVGNAHTSTVDTFQSESNTFNKLPSEPSPGVGHKVSNGYTEKAQAILSITRESKNILPSGPSPRNSATNGHNMMPKGPKDEEGIGIQMFPASTVLPSGSSTKVGSAHSSAVGASQSGSGTFNKLPSGSNPGVGHKVTNGYTEMVQESETQESAIMNKLPSGASPGVGNSATNGRDMMEKIRIEDEEGLMGIQTFNRLPSGSSPGVGHSYTNAHLPENIKIAEDRKGNDHIPIFHKLPGGPSPGGGQSSTVRMQLSSNVPLKTSSSASPRDGIISRNKLKPAGGSPKKKVEQIAGALDRKIGCDGGGLDFYGTLTPPVFGIAAAGN